MSESALAAVDTSALAADLALINGRLKRRLREQASIGDFTPSQIAVVLRLERDGPATVTTLAQAEGVRAQSMGATVAALKALGAVVGRPDPNDGRQTLLSLSDSFAAAVKAGRAARHDWLRQALEARFTAREQAQLATAVALLKRLVDC